MYGMKRVLIAAITGLLIITAGCSTEKYGAGTNASAKAVKVKDIFLYPELQGQTVTLEGKIVSQCQSNGCWFFLQDDTGNIFINLAPNNFSVPSRIGKNVKVTGIAMPGQEGYQVIASGVEVK
jgi:uncharacterized protein YdeI (BOF family)